jgi:hypothetical protein
MSEREKHLTRLIDEVAASGQTPADRAFQRESLAYGNLALEDKQLTLADVAHAAQRMAATRRDR